MNQTCRVVVLISGSGTNLQALIDAQQAGNLPIEIVGVISNRPNVAGLERAAKANIATKTVDHTEFSSREKFDHRIAEAIQSFNPDLVVLAGYMRIMTAELVQQFPGKMLNIHPSLLPKYPGLHTHRKAIENGESEHGSTVHFVTEELDGGPIIAQMHVNIAKNETEQSLIEKVKTIEHQLYPQVVKWFAEQRLQWKSGVIYFDNEALAQPIRL